MGGRANRLPVARRVGVDALAVPPGPGRRSGTAPNLLLLALASLLLRGGERVMMMRTTPARSPAAAAWTGCWRISSAAATTTPACRRTVRLPRHGSVVLFSDFLSPLEDIQAMSPVSPPCR